MRANETWNAVATPNTWGYHVLANLAGRNGAVLEDPTRPQMVWFIKSGGADGWPGAHKMGVMVYRTGDVLTVPWLNGYRCGSRWLRTPTEQLLFTDPGMLRMALEEVAGPLADAEQLDETGAGHNGRPEPAGGVRIRVGAAAPVVVGGRQPQADLVVEYVRRWVDLDMHRPPEGDPHGGGCPVPWPARLPWSSLSFPEAASPLATRPAFPASPTPSETTRPGTRDIRCRLR
ncbi:hypothetical protein GCM10017744_090860 [Streptomyces antimycoticus]|uniref:Uncharacterized protein n=1 Tax=Streptomyces antimycoticus TaxID=68175 RepID=A0A4D4JX09_9ACTN|nr:hypothetical protein SANT12839_002820 [Streptomyces antimycoticus]